MDYSLVKRIQPSMMLLVLLTLTASLADAASKDEDLITSLPGVSALNSTIYSGYVTVDEIAGRALFYFFVEAQTDSQSKPLTLWLNGGPGCSSFGVGAFIENGPFTLHSEDPVINRHSWHHVSNMLYLESPAGVGFSYSNNTSDYLDANDDNTALDSFNFLRGWVQKFPELKNRDFYIAGESYAGRYIPMLADLLVGKEEDSGLYLKGILMGNPTIDIRVDAGSLARIFFLWTHGQVSDDTYATVSKECGDLPLNRTLECLSILLLQTFATSPVAKVEVADPCAIDYAVPYFNREDVQAALHARLNNAFQPWDFCSDVLHYEIRRDQMQPLLKRLLENDVRVWVYSGDLDAVVPMTATRKIVNEFAKELGWNNTSVYKSWLVDNQIAGWRIRYGTGTSLLYTTVKGSGHMVPNDQPVRASKLFKSFLEEIDLI